MYPTPSGTTGDDTGSRPCPEGSVRTLSDRRLSPRHSLPDRRTWLGVPAVRDPYIASDCTLPHVSGGKSPESEEETLWSTTDPFHLTRVGSGPIDRDLWHLPARHSRRHLTHSNKNPSPSLKDRESSLG